MNRGIFPAALPKKEVRESQKNNYKQHNREELSVKEQKRKSFTGRGLLKAFVAALLIAVVMPIVAGVSIAYAAPESKKLIVYYSLSGNTKGLAELIQSLTGADIFELKLVDPYPEEYDAVVERARRELESGDLPALAENIANLADYDVVFLGTQNWFGSLSLPVFTFIDSHDLSGKTIVPFVTHGRGGLQDQVTDLKALIPNAAYLEEFAQFRDETVESDVSQWLARTGMLR